ncbi:TfuA-like protein [Chelativorans salis]|uniref:TfuA-like protein n=1 Tax=Chelativorans salis TaxID=2978478 RepID=A0ABT2LTL9_9HYPH|nr:TfuA-like protein [Chelativorans sp. EGI FJ00035]MCT7377880.1 TfuA-like protein [Chelativorans sp. EGI FJ00035]
MDYPVGNGSAAGETAEGPTVVFLGPTLPIAEAQAVLKAIYLHPAAQGDVVLAAHAFRPRAMVLIDGQFEDRPGVRHKEILWAMAQGITMIGAASMGALRAAELREFGMIGVGAVYRWFRRWALAPDDAVAVQSAPAEFGFFPLTDAMIDLQATFSRLMRDKMISPEERRALTLTARKMNFRDRTLKAVLCEAGWGDDVLDKFRDRIVRQKQRDALEALEIAPRLIGSAPRSLDWVWCATNTFIRDIEAGGIDPDLLKTYSRYCNLS